MRRLAALGVLLLGLVFGLHRIADPDLFQQIAVGRSILEHPGRIGVAEFHDAYPSYPYVADKWLASVVVAVVDAAGGEHGLMLYQLALNVALGFAWYRMFRRWGGAPALALLGVALAFLGCAFRTDPRPDTWSQVLLAWLIGCLGGRYPFARLVWVLPLTVALWVNVHGYFVNGLLVAALAAAAAGLGDASISFASAEDRGLSLRRGALLVGLGLVAACFHPQLWRAAAWPVRQLWILGESSILRESILEFASSAGLFRGMSPWHWALVGLTLAAAAGGPWLFGGRAGATRGMVGFALSAPWLIVPPPGLAQWPYRVTVALLALALTELPETLSRRRWFVAGWSLLAAALAVPLLRNQSLVPPAALLVLVPAWSRARLAPARGGGEHRPLARGVVRAVALSVLLLAVWARLGDFIAPGQYRSPEWSGWGFDRRALPIGAADFVARTEPPGPLLNQFDNGGYLLYRLHPSRKVFIAGNTSMYPASHLESYGRDVVGGGAAIEELSRRYGFRWAVLSHAALDSEPFVARLAHSREWRLVFLDHASAVFFRGLQDGAGPPAIDLDRRHAELDLAPPYRPLLPLWLLPRPRLYPDLNLAHFLLAAGRADLAGQEVLRHWTARPSAQLAVLGARAAEGSGTLGAWAARLEEALQVNPRASSLSRWLARALFMRSVERMAAGQDAAAEADLLRASALAPDEPGPYLALARLAAARGDADRARDLLRHALARAEGQAVRRAAEEDPLLRPLLP